MQPAPRATDPDAYPAYRRSERIADGVMHALGVSFALAGAALLLPRAAAAPDGQALAIAVYGAALVATFTASALYHLSPWERLRPALRRIDHAAIFLKIAGTFTPFVALAGGAFAWAVLGVVWTLALAGAAAKVFWWRAAGRWGPALYLGLGWLGLLLAAPMSRVLPAPALALVAAGGALYSAGVVFFRWDSLRYQVAIWHGFVLAASACMFAAVAMGAA